MAGSAFSARYTNLARPFSSAFRSCLEPTTILEFVNFQRPAVRDFTIFFSVHTRTYYTHLFKKVNKILRKNFVIMPFFSRQKQLFHLFLWQLHVFFVTGHLVGQHGVIAHTGCFLPALRANMSMSVFYAHRRHTCRGEKDDTISINVSLS